MYILQEPRGNVHAEHSSVSNNSAYQNINPQAGAESVHRESKSASITGSKTGKLLLAKELKEIISMKELMEKDGHKFKQSGRYYMCCCPFHDDSNPSFAVKAEYDNVGKCYACGWYGDIVKYEMDFHKVDFKTAWVRLNDFYYQCPRKGRID